MNLIATTDDCLFNLVLILKVTMVNRGAAEKAVKDANPIIDGRKANVNLAYLGAKPRNGFGLQNGSSGKLIFVCGSFVILQIT